MLDFFPSGAAIKPHTSDLSSPDARNCWAYPVK